ncbi:MAG: type II toxin-antitoxin system VapC family toxin [Sporichthyaceae bacterium]
MKFWDSSAAVPLLVEEEATDLVQSVFRQDPDLLVWWATELECVSALARHEREGGTAEVAKAYANLDALAMSWTEVQPSPRVRQSARRVLRVHPLRAADAAQLAAGLQASEGHPSTLEFVCLDERLRDAARREGFSVLP